MPSPQPTSLLDKVRRGSSLTEETPEEIQSLSSKAGLSAPPTTPLGGAMIGANPNQQKMLGDQRQKLSAMDLSQQASGESQLLQDVQRTRQLRTQQTAEEAGRTGKAEKLQGLGDVGTRVQNYIDAEIGKATTSTVASQAKGTIPGVSDADLPEFKSALQRLQKEPGNMELLSWINTKLGRNPNTSISPTELATFYQSATESVASGLAGNVDDHLTASDLISQPGFGYTADQLADLLGVPPEQVGQMTVGQIRDHINQLSATEFGSTAALQDLTTNSTAGAAEKGLARSQLREASATGTASVDASVASLANQVAKGDQVTFGGNTYGVDDLLKDSTLSDIVTSYLGAAAGSPTRTKLEQTEPDLVAWITKNKGALDDATASMAAGAQKFKDIQDANKAIGNVGGTSFDPELLKVILPNYGQVTHKAYSAGDIPLVRVAQELPPDVANKFVGTVNALSKEHPEFRQELAHMSPDDLKKLNLQDGIGGQKIQAFLANLQKEHELSSIDPDNDEQVYAHLFGETVKSQDVQSAVAEDHTRKLLGLPHGNASMIDQDGDGKPDAPQTLLDKLKKDTPKASLKDAAQGTVRSAATWNYADLQNQPTLNSAEKIARDKLGPLVADGPLTADKIKGAGLSEDELWTLADSPLPEKWGEAGKGLQDLVAASVQKHTDDIIFGTPQPHPVEDAEHIGTEDTENFDAGNGSTGMVASAGDISKLHLEAEENRKVATTLAEKISQIQQLPPEEQRKYDLPKLRHTFYAWDQGVQKLDAAAGVLAKKRESQIATLRSAASFVSRVQSQGGRVWGAANPEAAGDPYEAGQG